MSDIFYDLEIHSLICSKDVFMAVNNYKSLQLYDEFKNVPIYLHDDGSLRGEDISMLLKIDNVEIISKEYADSNINKYIKKYKYCKQYRLGKSSINLWHKIKLFDYYFFSKTKKILAIDTDLLFIHKPKAIIKYINSNTPFYFPDVQNAYSFNEPINEVSVLNNVNTGIIYIPSKEYYDISSIEFALSNLIKNGKNNFPSWIEQSAFSHMFYKNGNYINLPVDKYRIPFFQTIDVETIECLHFVSYPDVRNFYDDYLDYIKINKDNLIYSKKFFISYENNNIPLIVNIFKYDELILFKYKWLLKETNQNFLNHIFRIEYDGLTLEKLKESDISGFFTFKLESNSFRIYHTYEWYGKTNWLLLDDVFVA